ncbi:unnamed protein product [Pelagomonas calceolata]|uniref:Peroxisomal membrane protein MPV17 n=1 Tax=Pelagomonas calceolata TaxID=35677 RepID=A0A8J2WSN2_9STRA|nr:unnamed protein product [Pelagomonas calceolata]
MALSLPALSVTAFARAHPFAVGASAATLKAATADCMIQTCVEGRRCDEIDIKRVAVFTTFCFGFTGCWQYYLYNRVMPRLFPNVDAFLVLPVRERLRSAAGLRAVGGQVAIENVLNNALLYFPSFYAVQSLYQGGRAIDGLAKFRERWREDVPAIWSFWVPVQTANFLFSPLWARVPVTAAASLLWTSYVSFSRGCPGPCPQNAPTCCDGVGG